MVERLGRGGWGGGNRGIGSVFFKKGRGGKRGRDLFFALRKFFGIRSLLLFPFANLPPPPGPTSPLKFRLAHSRRGVVRIYIFSLADRGMIHPSNFLLLSSYIPPPPFPPVQKTPKISLSPLTFPSAQPPPHPTLSFHSIPFKLSPPPTYILKKLIFPD